MSRENKGSLKLVKSIKGKWLVRVYWDNDWDEYRVLYADAPPKRQDATSYHTGSREDAIDTGQCMADREEGWS